MATSSPMWVPHVPSSLTDNSNSKPDNSWTYQFCVMIVWDRRLSVEENSIGQYREQVHENKEVTLEPPEKH